MSDPLRITVNGSPATAEIRSLHGEPEHPRAGDALDWRSDLPALPWLPIVLENERVIALQVDRWQVYQGNRPLAALINLVASESGYVVRNPLATMSPEEIHGLRGLNVGRWDETVASALLEIDPENLMLMIGSGMWEQIGELLRVLPKGVRYLEMRLAANDRAGCVRELLASLGELRYLHYTGPPFEMTSIAAGDSLRHLSLGVDHLKSPEVMATFHDLRELAIGIAQEVKGAQFLRGLPKLRRLHLLCTDANDLRSLEGHAELRWIDASWSPIRSLPIAVPNLRSLNLTGTRVSDQEVAEFAARHPECKVYHRWAALLREAVKGTTVLRIHDGPLCCSHPTPGARDVRDPEVIQALLDGVDVDEEKSRSISPSCAQVTLDFMAGEKLLVRIGVKGACLLSAIWGLREWSNEAVLKPDSLRFVRAWLSENGAPLPKP